MIHFTLLPDKKLWDPSERFPDSNQLYQMYDLFPDYKFTPWLFHINIGHSDIYIQRIKSKWVVKARNIKTRYPLALCNNYLKGTYDTWLEAYTMFHRLCIELLENQKEVKEYGLPF